MLSLYWTTLLFTEIYFCGAINYNGPAEQIYFQQEVNAILNANHYINFEYSTVEWMDTISNSTEYIKFNLTSLKQFCSNPVVTTCCHDIYENDYDEYCGNSSLDTILYLLREKRGQVTLLDTSDDSSSKICSNTKKSMIDLSDYDEEIYFLGVGGFAQDSGQLYIGFTCPHISFPMQESTINITNENIENISCNSTLHGQYNTHHQHVSYYRLDLDFKFAEMYPVIISTCNIGNKQLDTSPLLSHSNTSVATNYDHQHDPYASQYDTYMYLIRNMTTPEEHTATYEITHESDHSTICESLYPSDIILNNSIDYANGEYIIAVQGYYNWPGNFSLFVTCDSASVEPIAPSVPKQFSFQWLGFGIFMLLMFLFIIFSVYQWRKYRIKHPKTAVRKEYCQTKLSDRSLSLIDFSTSQMHKHNNDDNEEQIAEESITANELFTENQSEPNTKFDVMQIQTTITNPKRIAINESISNMTDGEDRIQRCIQHAMKCCQDQSGVDVYQVLAIRSIDKKSQEPYVVKPFKVFGCDYEFVAISPLYQATFMAVIVMLLQTMGITFVVYKLYAYVWVMDANTWCSLEVGRWQSFYSVKILSFLWSLVITFSLNEVVRTVKHSGLYKSMTELNVEELGQIEGDSFWFLIRCGQMINYYACLIAAIGCFFIILEMNKGEENDGFIDYSHSGLDMIVLFVMVKLDDIIVQYYDYQDVGDFLKTFYKEYSNNKNTNESEEHSDIRKCSNNCCGHTAEGFSFFVKFCLFAIGIITPFLIFICW